MFPESRFARSEEEIDRILALVGYDGGAVLDLCCGPGRHACALARRGIPVTGVDRTAFLLERGRERAAELGVEVEFVQEDMLRFVRENAYSLVVNMFTAFGYFDDKGDDLTVLRNIHRSLTPGGTLLIDLHGKERIARIFQPTTSSKEEDGTLFIQRHEIFDDWTRIRNEWILIKDEQVRSFAFHHTVYSGEELRSLMQQAGFRQVKLYGDLDGSEYGTNTARLIAVGRK
jgi:SAM-dependent methyltransferase